MAERPLAIIGTRGAFSLLIVAGVIACVDFARSRRSNSRIFAGKRARQPHIYAAGVNMSVSSWQSTFLALGAHCIDTWTLIAQHVTVINQTHSVVTLFVPYRRHLHPSSIEWVKSVLELTESPTTGDRDVSLPSPLSPESSDSEALCVGLKQCSLPLTLPDDDDDDDDDVIRSSCPRIIRISLIYRMAKRSVVILVAFFSHDA